jgi:hypothetical protein
MTANKSYTAREGDTFKKIARAIFGDEIVARVLAQFNKMNETDALAGGTPLKIPDRVHVPKQTKSENGTPVTEVDVLMPNLDEVHFYINRGGQKVTVEGPKDLTEEEYPHKKDVVGADGKTTSKNIRGVEVFIQETEKVLGRASTLQGCKGIGDYGKNNLYSALIKGGVPGIPDGLTERHKRIWASIYFSEGALEAINSYDSAFLSFGPLQQTMGTGTGSGELAAALNYVKENNSGIYDNYFGKFGLQPTAIVKDAINVERGYCSLNGKIIKTAQDKEEYRKFIWAYRCVLAMSDLQFRKLFLEYGLKRINLIENMKATVDGKTLTFKDIFKSELAHALMLDAHINLPAAVDSNHGMWVKAAKEIKTIDQLAKADISPEEEQKMIGKMIEVRNNSLMWSPKLRASYIVLCMKDLNDDSAKKIGYSEMKAIFKDAGLQEKVAKTYMYDFLRLERD